MDEFSGEIENLWEQLQKPGSKLREEAIEKGLPAKELDELRKHKYDEVIELRRGAALDPASVALVVAFAPVAAKITKDVWEHLILPRLVKRFGRGTIEPKDKPGK
jgi:hypothetical protein